MNSGMIGLSAARMLKQAVVTRAKKLSEVAFSTKYLFYTNVGISFTLSDVGDALEQHYEVLSGSLEEWDKTRTRKMAISGITVGIVCHHYYAFLDKSFPGRTFKMLVRKVLIDQLVCSPLCIGTFFLTMAYLEDAPWQEFINNTKARAWRLYAAEWIVWPPAQVINFYFLPPKFRVLYDSTISLGYDVYTSYVNHNISYKKDSDS